MNWGNTDHISTRFCRRISALYYCISKKKGKLFCGVCINNVTSECFVCLVLNCCILWCLLGKTLEYIKLFESQIQVYQNTKKRPVLEVLDYFLSWVLV